LYANLAIKTIICNTEGLKNNDMGLADFT